MRISVIMPVFLGEYPGAAPRRAEKFIRAVNSFLAQTHQEKELIIISDGCEKTNIIYKERWTKKPEIKLLKLKRHPPFTGAVRQQGIDIASGDVLCNLDSDDTIGNYHLSNIAAAMQPQFFPWVYFNYFRELDAIKNHQEHVIAHATLDGLCTANVAWRRDLDVTWNDCDGRQDNKAFNRQLLEKYPFTDASAPNKIWGCEYRVHHAVINKLNTNT